MSEHRRSYWKTVIVALAGVGVLLAVEGRLLAHAVAAGGRWSAVVWGLWLAEETILVLVLVLCLLVAVGGLVSLRRDWLETRGRPYGLPASARYARRRRSP